MAVGTHRLSSHVGAADGHSGRCPYTRASIAEATNRGWTLAVPIALGVRCCTHVQHGIRLAPGRLEVRHEGGLWDVNGTQTTRIPFTGANLNRSPRLVREPRTAANTGENPRKC